VIKAFYKDRSLSAMRWFLRKAYGTGGSGNHATHPKKGKFIVIKKRVITSARKYLDNGIFKTQGIFYLIYAMYKLAFHNSNCLGTYRYLIRQENYKTTTV
jgi:hypothetical protein